jgi:hypothetical protein
MDNSKKPFECESGIVYNMPSNHCVFCGHCTDIFYDYSNGPYMCICDIGGNGYKECKLFSERTTE